MDGLAYKVKRETDMELNRELWVYDWWEKVAQRVSGHKHDFYWTFKKMCAFLRLCFWVIDVVWQPQYVSSAKRINLKFSMNKLQRISWEKWWEYFCVCTILCLYVFIQYNVCAYMRLRSRAQSGFIRAHICVCFCVLSQRRNANLIECRLPINLAFNYLHPLTLTPDRTPHLRSSSLTSVPSSVHLYHHPADECVCVCVCMCVCVCVF